MLHNKVKYQVPDRRYIWRKTLDYHRGLPMYLTTFQKSMYVCIMFSHVITGVDIFHWQFISNTHI